MFNDIVVNIKKRNPLKKWSQIYTERVDQIKEKKVIKQKDIERKSFYFFLPDNEKEHFILEDWEKKMDSPEFMKKDALLKAFRSARSTEININPPPDQSDWNSQWGCQHLCYICNKPAISDISICTKCDMVAHKLCVLQFNFKSSSIKSYHELSKELRDHRCPQCYETMAADIQYYEQFVNKIREKKLEDLCADIIGKRVLVFVEKKKLQRKKAAIIKVQAMLRGISTRLKIKTILRQRFRVVLIDIKSLPSFLKESGVVIITVHDTFKNSQIFRFDKTYETALTETIMIPGLSWHQSVLINIGVKDETVTYAYSIVGQAQLAIRDITNFNKKNEIKLNFQEQIMV